MHAISSLSEAIVTTVRYFDRLDFVLTADELSAYLYGLPARRDEVVAQASIIPQLRLVDGYYCLAGREDLVSLRREKNRHAQLLWKKVARWGWLCALVPFVKMVAVCNTLSYGNVRPTSDIDLFVVTEARRLGTARFFFKVFTQLFGLRVHHEKIEGRLCLSFFVTEEGLSLAPIAHKYDPHLAYFVRTMKVIHDRDMYKKFIQANSQWIIPYFHKELRPDLSRQVPHPFVGVFRWLLEFLLRLGGPPLEKFFWSIQHRKDLARARALSSPQASVVLTSNVFKFHEADSRREIANSMAIGVP